MIDLSLTAPWRATALTLAITAASVAHAAEAAPLTVQFGQCTEFVGLAPVDAVGATALLPAQYQLVISGGAATLVVRVTDCQAIRVADAAPKPGRLAQVGLLIVSPDGTATDPNTSINNYTLSYTSNLPLLVQRVKSSGVPASLDEGLAYEFAPATGRSELYAAVAPDEGGQPRFTLHGSVSTPTIPIPFLANWWRGSGAKAVKMSSTFPDILFDFTSEMSFTTSHLNVVGRLLPGNQVASFPVSFRGAYHVATMVVTTP